MPGTDTSHVALIDAGVHLHVREVLRNHKKLGGLQTGCHGLAFFYRAFDHDAVHRRGNAGPRQINPGLGQRGLALRHVGLRRLDLRVGHGRLCLGRLQSLPRGVDQGAGAVGLALRDKLLFHQTLLAFQIAPCLVQIDLGARHLGPACSGRGLRRQHRGTCGIHIGLGRSDPVFEGLRIDLGDQLAGFHLGIEIHEQITYLPRYLGAHRDLRHRIDGSTG